LIQNIIVLRFANPVMQEVWSSKSISAVKISLKEDAGVSGRGGYYDSTGCIRDVFQNHLLQVLSLVAMEEPKSLLAEHIRDAKVAVVKCIKTPTESDEVIVGQYTKNGSFPGYLDDDTVADDSNTETFCQMVLYIENDRWRNVPFICIAGKGLDERRAEVIIKFKRKSESFLCRSSNELVIRIQPDESISFRVNVKTPGLSNVEHVVATDLNLSYKHKFQLPNSLPDAYTKLILEVLKGDHELFVRVDELMEAWRVVDEVVQSVRTGSLRVQPYVRGSQGPEAANVIVEKHWEHQKRMS